LGSTGTTDGTDCSDEVLPRVNMTRTGQQIAHMTQKVPQSVLDSDERVMAAVVGVVGP